MECEIYSFSVSKLRHQVRGRVLGSFVSPLLSVVGRNCDCSSSDSLTGVVTFASLCRETALAVPPRQGVTSDRSFIRACQEERKAGN